MKQVGPALYTGFSKTKLILVSCAGLFYIAGLLYSGGSLAAFLLYGTVFFLYGVLPAWATYNLLHHSPALRILVSVTASSALLAVSYLFARGTGLLWSLWVLPLLLPAGYITLQWRTKGFVKPALSPIADFIRQRPHWQLLALLYGFLLVCYTLEGVLFFARPSTVGDILPSQDLLWNVGNAASFKLAVPPVDIRFAGVPLRYHFLNELLAATFSQLTGISCYDILAFYQQPFMLAVLLLCLYQFASTVFHGSRLKSCLFVFSFFLLGCATLWRVFRTGTSIYWNLNALHLITNINSQATGTIFLCAFSGLFVALARRKFAGAPLLRVFLCLSFVMLCFSKGPVGAIIICAVTASLAAGLLFKKTNGPALMTGLVLIALFALVYTNMYSGGAASSTQLNLTGTLSVGPLWGFMLPHLYKGPAAFYSTAFLLYLAQSFLTMPAQFPFYLLSLGRDLTRLSQLALHGFYFQSAAAGGLLAYFIFAHCGMSQMYFLFAALFFINLLAVEKGVNFFALPSARPRAKKFGRVLVGICLAIGLASSLFSYAYLGGKGLRQWLRSAGWYPQKEYYFHPATRDDEAAALWLENNAPPGSIFATNRVYQSYVSQFFSSFSQRQAYMEGYHYTKTNMGVSEQLIQERWQVLQQLFGGGLVPEDVAKLAREQCITHLVYVDTPNDIGAGEIQFAALEKVFDSPTVRIYKIP